MAEVTNDGRVFRSLLDRHPAMARTSSVGDSFLTDNPRRSSSVWKRPQGGRCGSLAHVRLAVHCGIRTLAAIAVACLLAAALGAGAVWHFTHREPPLPDAPALVVKVREVARLQALDVSLYKKVAFAPDPRETGSVWSDLMQWASWSLRPPRGRAIVFAEAHLAVDLAKLDASSLRVSGRRVEVVLPK